MDNEDLDINEGDTGIVLYVIGPMAGRYGVRVKWDKMAISNKGQSINKIAQVGSTDLEPIDITPELIAQSIE